jgi:replicative DNA helicase
MNIAERAALSGKSVLVFSLEMPSDQLLIRAACSIGKMDHEKVKRGELDDHELSALTSSVARLKDKNMIIDDRPMLTSEQAMSRARKFQRKLNAPLELIVVDYIQLMNDKGQEIDRITNITRNLKLMAKSMNCPVIALSQLNRDCDKRVNARPIMSDLRSSGSIEQDADIIAFVYRDEMYHKDTKDKGVAEIIIGKFRNGQPGTVYLAARLDQSRFDNLVGYTSSQSEQNEYSGFSYQ